MDTLQYITVLSSKSDPLSRPADFSFTWLISPLSLLTLLLFSCEGNNFFLWSSVTLSTNTAIPHFLPTTIGSRGGAGIFNKYSNPLLVCIFLAWLTLIIVVFVIFRLANRFSLISQCSHYPDKIIKNVCLKFQKNFPRC